MTLPLEIFGLKDQTLAMQWIKDNIEFFGGDSNSITIFGASAGGISAHMHMMSPLSKGLFHRAICMSGLATAPFNEPTQDPLALAKRQAEVVGIADIENMTTNELVSKLRAINASLLVDSIDDLKYWSVDPLMLYRPVIENEAPGAFITKHPKEIWSSGDFEHVPWMTGVVPNEGSVRTAALLSNKDLLDELNFRMDYLLPKLMELSPKDTNSLTLINRKIYDFYLNGSNMIDGNNTQGFQNVS